MQGGGDAPRLLLRAALSHLELAVANLTVQKETACSFDEESRQALCQHSLSLQMLASAPSNKVPVTVIDLDRINQVTPLATPRDVSPQMPPPTPRDAIGVERPPPMAATKPERLQEAPFSVVDVDSVAEPPPDLDGGVSRQVTPVTTPLSSPFKFFGRQPAGVPQAPQAPYLTRGGSKLSEASASQAGSIASQRSMRSQESSATVITSPSRQSHVFDSRQSHGRRLSFADIEGRNMQLRQLFLDLDTGSEGAVDIHLLKSALEESGFISDPVHKALEVLSSDSGGKHRMLRQVVWLDLIDNAAGEYALLENSSSSMTVAQKLERKSSFARLKRSDATNWSGAVSSPSYCMLKHRSSTRRVWDMSMTVVLLYIAFVLPFHYGFEVGAGIDELMNTLDYMVDVLLALDIVLNFRTTYRNSEGTQIHNSYLVAKHYCKTWFVVDLLSCLPVQWLISFDFNLVKLSKTGKVFKAFKVLKLTRLLKCLDSSTEMSGTIELLSLSLPFRRTMKVLAVLLLSFGMTHWVACFMAVSGGGFLENYDQDEVHDQVGKSYLAALYWAMTTLTTVGYGDITPTSDTERGYAIVAMALGGAFYGYIVATIGVFVLSKNMNERAFFDRMDLVQAWLRHHALPKEIRQRIIAYFTHFLKQKAAVDEVAILNDLAPSLAEEVSAYLIPHGLRHCYLFEGLSASMLARFVELLQRHEARPGDLMVDAGTPGVGLFIIIEGSALQVADGAREDDAGSEFSKVLTSDDCWGEEVLLGISGDYKYKVVCRSPMAFYLIHTTMFNKRFGKVRDLGYKMKENYEHRRAQSAERRPSSQRAGRSTLRRSYGGLPPRFCESVLDGVDEISQRLRWLEFEVARKA